MIKNFEFPKDIDEIFSKEFEESNFKFCLNDLIGKNLFAVWKNYDTNFSANATKFELNSCNEKQFIITEKNDSEVDSWISNFNKTLKIKKLSSKLSSNKNDEEDDGRYKSNLVSFEYKKIGVIEDIQSFANMKFTMSGNTWMFYIHGDNSESNIVYMNATAKNNKEHFEKIIKEKNKNSYYDNYVCYISNYDRLNGRYSVWSPAFIDSYETQNSLSRRPFDFEMIKEFAEKGDRILKFYNIKKECSVPIQRKISLILKVKDENKTRYLDTDLIVARDDYNGIGEAYLLNRFSEVAYGQKSKFTSKTGFIKIKKESYIRGNGFEFEYNLGINEKTNFFEEIKNRKTLDPISYLVWSTPDPDTQMNYIKIAKGLIKKTINEYFKEMNSISPKFLNLINGF